MEKSTNCPAIELAWYQHRLSDGAIYFTPQRQSKRRVILAGSGDCDPTPAELARALLANPEAEVEAAAKLLIVHDAEDTEEQSVPLPGGVYSFERSDHHIPNRLEPMTVRSDVYLKLPGIHDRLADDIRHFVAGEATYRELGFQYRRGILLYGPPGNGKTSLIREVVRNELPEDSVVIFMDRIPPRNFIRAIQTTLRERFKAVIFEELAATIKASDLDQVLAFLDGETSLNRCLILATTNYPSRLPGNIVDRPSRFDRLYRISDPDDATRKSLLEHYLKRPVGKSEVEMTRGLSTSGLREACLLTHFGRLALSKASESLKRHRDLVKREFGEMGEIGLGSRGRFEYWED